MALADAVERASQSMQRAAEVESRAFGEVDQGEVLKLIGLNPRDPRAHAVVAVARRYALDPVLGHIAIIPKSAMPYITRDGYIHIAHRSGQFDGMEVIDGPRREGREWVATVAVYRRDMTHAFVYPGRADLVGNGPEMAITRAERRALKRAFAVALPAAFGDDDGNPLPASYEPLSAPLSAPEGDARVSGTAEPQTGAQGRDEDEPEAPGMILPAQRRAIFAECQRLGLADDERRDDRLALISGIVNADIESTTHLTESQARVVISALREIPTPSEGAQQ